MLSLQKIMGGHETGVEQNWGACVPRSGLKTATDWHCTVYGDIWFAYFITFVRVLVAFISHIGDIALNVRPHHVNIGLSFAVIKTDILQYCIIGI